jgi:type III secretion system needle length determinant
MNTINSASNSGHLSEASAGEHAAEVSDPSALEVLKALLDQPSGMQGGGEDLLSDDDQSGGPDWSIMEGAAAPPVPGVVLVVPGNVPLVSDDPGQTVAVPQGGGASTWTDPSASTMPETSVGTGRVGEFASEALKSLVKTKPEEPLPLVSAGGPQAEAVVAAEVQPDTLGSAILDSFFSQSSSVSAPAPVAGAEAPNPVADRVAKIENLMNTMLDRVLVTDPLSGQNQEVRIKFQDGILPGTEARLWREDGRLMVEFVSTKAESVRWLEGSIAMLSQRLDERLSHTSPSQVTVNSSGDAPSDGRSRERNTPWDQARQQQQQEEATA